MIEVLEERDGWRVRLEPDMDPLNPREDYDQLGFMFCAHNRYTLGDHKDPRYDDVKALVDTAYEEATSRQEFFTRVKDALVEQMGATVVLPLGLIDHSGISMYIGGGAHIHDPGGWDSGTVGFIFDTAEDREKMGTPVERVEKCLRGEVAEYDQYLTGDVWGYVIERQTTWTSDQGAERTSWEDEESCWGFYGGTYAMEQAKEAFAAYPPKEGT